MSTTIADLVVVLSANPTKFMKGMDQATSRLQATSDRAMMVGRSLSLGITAPMIGAGIAAVKMAADFDNSLTMISSLVGIARSEVMGWKSDIRSIAKETGKSSKELADAMFFITSAGLRGAESIHRAMELLKASAQASMVGLGETRLVAFAAASAMNAYGHANLEAEEAVAILIATIREGNVMANTLAPTLGRVLPVASAMGVEFREVGAALAAMTRVGVNAEEAATSLRQIIASISKPTAQARSALDEMGISADMLRAKLRDNLLETLFFIRDAFKDNEEAVFKVFGNIRALSGVLNLTGKNAEKAREIFKNLAKVTGKDLVNSVEAAEQSLKVKLLQTWARLQDALLEFGEYIAPTVIAAITKIGYAVESLTLAFSNQTPLVQKLIMTFVALVAIAGPVSLMYGNLLRFIPMITGAIAAQTVAAEASMLAGAKLPIWMSGVGIAGASLITVLGTLGSAWAGWQIGKAISDMTGLTEATSDMKDTLTEATDQIELMNSEQLTEHVGLLMQMAERHSDVVRVADIFRAAIENNTRALARYNDELLKAAHSQVEDDFERKRVEAAKAAAAAEKEVLTAQQQVERAMMRINELGFKRRDQIIDSKKLLSEADVITQLDAEIQAWKEIIASGIHINQLVRERGSNMNQLLQDADDYGSTLTVNAGKMIEKLREADQGPMADLLESFDSMGQHIDLQPGKMVEGFETASKSLQDNLENAFRDAYAAGGDGWDDFVGKVEEGITVEIVVGPDNIPEFVNEIKTRIMNELEGKAPPGGGKAP